MPKHPHPLKTRNPGSAADLFNFLHLKTNEKAMMCMFRYPVTDCLILFYKRRMSRRVVDSDFNHGIPESIYWNEAEVAEWVEEQGFPQYKDCFLTNFVTGRKLIAIDTSALPSMGITDFEDMKILTKLIRDLIGIPKLHPKREIAMQNPKVAYLELKRRTGRLTDNTTFKTFCHQHMDFFSPK